MFQTSDTRNNEIITLNLSIGQIKLLETLVDAKLSSVEVGASDFNKNALKTLLDVFMAKTQETDEERNARFKHWVGGLRLVGG